jgi:hypothetical protein
MIEEFTLLNLSVLEEHIESGLAEWNDVLKNIPEDALGEWSGGQGACVSPSSVVLQQLDEFGEVNLFGLSLGTGPGVIEHLSHVPVMEVGAAVKGEWEIVGHGFEEEAENTVAEGGQALGGWLELVDDVELEVHELAID